MLLQISHETRYSYSGEVTPGLHYLHFYPQQRPYLKVIEVLIDVSPVPNVLTARTDAENNIYHQCWFSNPTESMEVHADIKVETTEFNPFAFLIDTYGPQDAESYRKNTEAFLTPYLTDIALSPGILAFTAKFSSLEPLDLVVSLSETIAADWDHRERFEHNILDPDTCFSQRSGSCRDLTRMMMAILRHVGMPARFVSGYAYVEGDEKGHELHAWVETFIPGAGWVGADPSLGLLTTDRYIPVATSFDPARTMPIQGFYSGSAASNLDTTVTITEV